MIENGLPFVINGSIEASVNCATSCVIGSKRPNDFFSSFVNQIVPSLPIVRSRRPVPV